MSVPNILITGANGFLGSNLVKLLSSTGKYKVHAMVRPRGTVNFLHSFQKHPETGEDQFKLVEANLTNDAEVEKAAENMDIIVHLAGMVSDWGRREDFYDLNVEGTKRVLRAADKAGVSKVIYLSSLTVHAMTGHNYSDENTPADMRNFPYGETKKIGEDLVLQWAEKGREKGLVANVVRPGFVIYGPYDKNTFINVLKEIDKGRFGFIDKGKKLISYVYVENLCSGIERLISSYNQSGTFNILDGNMSWQDWVSRWADALGVKAPRLSAPYWAMLPLTALLVGFYKLFRIKSAPILTLYRIRIMYKDLAFSNRKSVEKLGYSPAVPFEESIKRTLDFYSSAK